MRQYTLYTIAALLAGLWFFATFRAYGIYFEYGSGITTCITAGVKHTNFELTWGNAGNLYTSVGHGPELGPFGFGSWNNSGWWNSLLLGHFPESRWLPYWETYNRQGAWKRTLGFSVHYFLIMAGALLVTAVWRRRRGKTKTVRCAKCGYDLRGTPSGLCPECGAPNPPPLKRDDGG